MPRTHAVHASLLRTVSVQAGLAARVCIFAVAPQIIFDAWTWIHSSVNDLHADDLGPALLLAVLLAGFLEPLRDMIIRPDHHGAQAGLGSFALTVLLTVPLVLMHGPLEGHLHSGIERPLNVALGQGLIALFLTLAWLAEQPVLRWALGTLAVLMPLIVGYRLGWALDETWGTFGVCLVISLLAMPRFRPWDRNSIGSAAAIVLLIGAVWLGATLLLHVISIAVVRLPSWLLYQGPALPSAGSAPAPVWWTTWLEDLLFYAGWSLGLFVHRGRTPEAE